MNDSTCFIGLYTTGFTVNLKGPQQFFNFSYLFIFFYHFWITEERIFLIYRCKITI